MTSLSQEPVLTVFLHMVPPTVSRSSNRAAGVTDYHPMRTMSAAAIRRFFIVRENQLRRPAQRRQRFPDSERPDDTGQGCTAITLNLSTIYAQFAPSRSIPIVRCESDAVVEAGACDRSVVRVNLHALDALVVLDAPLNLDALVVRDTLVILDALVCSKSVSSIVPSLVPSANCQSSAMRNSPAKRNQSAKRNWICHTL